jgi:hypothetical protein
MRRWRTAAGDILAEAPPGDRKHFYLLDPSGRIRNTYQRSQHSVQEELITLEYAVVGDEFYCFGTVDVEGTIRQSERSEFGKLIELSPDHSPTERDVLDVLAADHALRETEEAAIQRRVAAAAAPAGPVHADLGLALANSVVRWPLHTRVKAQMLAILVQLAALPHGALTATATDSILAAARCIAGQGRCNEQTVPAAHPPTPAASLTPEVAALFTALEAFVARLPEEATRADENSDSVYSEEGRCLRQAAEHLRHAIGEIGYPDSHPDRHHRR